MYTEDAFDTSIMMDDKRRERAFFAIVNIAGSEGVAAGATIGGVLGAIVAGLMATGSVVAILGTDAIPLPVGPVAAALSGLGAGAVGGGIVGGLIGVGIGESRAKQYEKRLNRAEVFRALDRKRPVSTRGEIDPDRQYAGRTRSR